MRLLGLESRSTFQSWKRGAVANPQGRSGAYFLRSRHLQATAYSSSKDGRPVDSEVEYRRDFRRSVGA